MEFSVIRKLIIDRECVDNSLMEVLESLNSCSATNRKVALACWAFCIYRKMIPPREDQITLKHSYLERSILLCIYSAENKEDDAYMQSKRFFKKTSDAGKSSNVVLFFVPRKFESEGRIYKMTLSDLERIVSEQKWSSLPDPKNCFCWTQIDTESTENSSDSNKLNSGSSNQSLDNPMQSPSQALRASFRRNDSLRPETKRKVSFSPMKMQHQSSSSPARGLYKRTTQLSYNSIKVQSCHENPTRGVFKIG
jgi:hypothetical protein